MMDCTRFQTDGMRLLDGELSDTEKTEYEAHVRGCDECQSELSDLGRVVDFTDELRLRTPDDEFWDGYWESVYRRSERGFGFVLLMLGLIVLAVVGVIRAVTSPEFWSYEGISVTAILIGLVVIFVSVVRERFHERKNDPYRGVQR